MTPSRIPTSSSSSRIRPLSSYRPPHSGPQTGRHPLKSLDQLEDSSESRGFKRPTASMAADGCPSTAALDEALKPFQERASEAEIRIAKLEALLYNKDGLSRGSEATSSAVKDLQSKLDAATAECLTEKEKNEKLQYRMTHLIRAIKEAESR